MAVTLSGFAVRRHGSCEIKKKRASTAKAFIYRSEGCDALTTTNATSSTHIVVGAVLDAILFPPSQANSATGALAAGVLPEGGKKRPSIKTQSGRDKTLKITVAHGKGATSKSNTKYTDSQRVVWNVFRATGNYPDQLFDPSTAARKPQTLNNMKTIQLFAMRRENTSVPLQAQVVPGLIRARGGQTPSRIHVYNGSVHIIYSRTNSNLP